MSRARVSLCAAVGLALVCALLVVASSVEAEQEWQQPVFVETLESAVLFANDVDHRGPTSERLCDRVMGDRFKRFKALYGKKYANETEAAKRFATFRSNRRKIVALNDAFSRDRAQPIFRSSSRFADMEETDFRRRLGFLPKGAAALSHPIPRSMVESSAAPFSLEAERVIAARCGVNLNDFVSALGVNEEGSSVALIQLDSHTDTESEADSKADSNSQSQAVSEEHLSLSNKKPKRKASPKKHTKKKKQQTKGKTQQRKPAVKLGEQPLVQPAATPVATPVEQLVEQPEQQLVPQSEPVYSIDWRDHITPIKTQGDCGSCWAHVAVQQLEGARIRAGKARTVLSTPFIMDCSLTVPNNGCNGGNVQIALDDMKAVRTPTLTSYNYNVDRSAGTCRMPSGARKGLLQQVASWEWAGVPCYRDEECVIDEALTLQALKDHGPLAIAVDAAQFQFYNKGIFPSSKCSPDAMHMNHAMELIGHGTEDGQAFWLLRNTWDTSFGEAGFIRIPYGENACGVANQASYIASLA